MFIIFYGLFLLCMYLPSATEIKDITLFSNEEEVVSPSRLIIPCHFTTDDPISIPNNLLLEWRMSPEGSHSYSTILKLFETVLENVKTANERAQVFVSQVPDGNCSLVINPTYVNDSGTYKVKLTLDGIPYYNTPQIRISVINPGDIQTTIHAIEGDILMAGGVNGNEPSRVLDNDTIHLRTFSRPSCSDYDSDVLRFARKYQRIKKAGLLKGLLSTCFMEFFLLLGNLGALIIGRKYCKLKKLKKEADEEAGEHTEKAAKEGNILEDIPARIIGKLRKTVDMTVEYVKNKAGQKIVDKMKKEGKEGKKVQVSTKEKKEDLGKKEEKVNRRENRKTEEKETKKEKEEKENIKGKEEKEHKRNREYKGEKETKTEKESIKKKVEKEPKEKEKKQVKEIKGEKVQKENKSEKEKKEEKQKKKEVHPPADENMEEIPWLPPKELPPPLP